MEQGFLTLFCLLSVAIPVFARVDITVACCCCLFWPYLCKWKQWSCSCWVPRWLWESFICNRHLSVVEVTLSRALGATKHHICFPWGSFLSVLCPAMCGFCVLVVLTPCLLLSYICYTSAICVLVMVCEQGTISYFRLQYKIIARSFPILRVVFWHCFPLT